MRLVVNRVRIAIAVDDDALGRLEDVAKACRELGFLGDTMLSGVGVLTGTIEPDSLAALRAVPGVAAVELERQSRLVTPPGQSI
jgi:hypothetical protein